MRAPLASAESYSCAVERLGNVRFAQVPAATCTVTEREETELARGRKTLLREGVFASSPHAERAEGGRGERGREVNGIR